MQGKIIITRSGYDPDLGKHIKDPFLGDVPSLGACRPDVRKLLVEGDHLFFISGRAPGLEQYVMGGFEIDQKISPLEAYERFPEQRLHALPDGQLAGNVVIDRKGRQHRLDKHPRRTFDARIQNYVIGRNPILIQGEEEVSRGRMETLTVLQDILKKPGNKPIEVVGRWGAKLDERQVHQMRDWLQSIKAH